MHFCFADFFNTSTDFVVPSTCSRLINPLAVPTTSSFKHNERNQVNQNTGNGVVTNNRGDDNAENSIGENKYEVFPLIGQTNKEEEVEYHDSDVSEEPLDVEEENIADSLMKYNSNNGIKCTFCPNNEKAFERRGFIIHLRYRHFVCHLCGVKLQTYELLATHYSSVHAKKFTKPGNTAVNKMYRSKRKYKKRNNESKVQLKKENKTTASTSEIFNCIRCSSTFTTQNDIEAHMLWKHNISTQPRLVETYTCCFQTFNSRKKYVKHLQSPEHQDSLSAEMKQEAIALSAKQSKDPSLINTNPRVCLKRMYKCPDCSFTTESARGHKIHQAVAHSKANRSVQKGQLQSVPNSKEGQNPIVHGFPCKICGFIGSSLGFLRLHKRKKHGEVARDQVGAQCSICLKLFTNKGYLKRHMKAKHTPDQKFPKKKPSSLPPPSYEMTREWMDNGPRLDMNQWVNID